MSREEGVNESRVSRRVESSKSRLCYLKAHRRSKLTPTYWLEVHEPSATNLACVARLNLWGVEWRGDLVDLASKSHREIRVVT